MARRQPPEEWERFLLDTLRDRRYPDETRRFFRMERVHAPAPPPARRGVLARLRRALGRGADAPGADAGEGQPNR